MDLGLGGRKCLVTGASRGLGFSVARALALEGGDVTLVSSNKENLQSAADKLSLEVGSKVAFEVCDLSKKDEIEALAERYESEYGKVDVLVCNAGGPPPGPILEKAEGDWKKALDLNMMSTIRLCRAFVPAMVENGYGRVLIITSIAVRNPIDGLGLSNAARAGATGFAKTLAREVASKGVTVNCICPGYTRTERLESLAESISKDEGIEKDAVFRRWTASIPAGRLGEPEELGALAAFLCSTKAAYITGTSIPVDGGADRSLI